MLPESKTNMENAMNDRQMDVWMDRQADEWLGGLLARWRQTEGRDVISICQSAFASMTKTTDVYSAQFPRSDDGGGGRTQTDKQMDYGIIY